MFCRACYTTQGILCSHPKPLETNIQLDKHSFYPRKTYTSGYLDVPKPLKSGQQLGAAKLGINLNPNKNLFKIRAQESAEDNYKENT